MTQKTIDVAVGVVVNELRQIFITKRADHVHQGGLWEFPGGKRELGESRRDALTRELNEELGIQVLGAQPLIQISHDYGDKTVRLDVWEVSQFSGTPHGREGQQGCWVNIADLSDYTFPAANQAIINAIQLPDIYAITGQDSNVVIEQVQQALIRGVRLFQLRLKAPYEETASIAKAILPEIHNKGGRCLINSDIDWVDSLGFDGVHLSQTQLEHLSERPLQAPLLVAGSCHDAQSLKAAEALGVDFAVLSPVQPTESHPGARVLGWSGFQSLNQHITIPVYALGGLNEQDVTKARESGGRGVAAIRGVGF